MKGRVRFLNHYKCILPAVLCLILVACGADVGALLPTDQAISEGMTSERVESTKDNTTEGTQSEEFHPLTYQVDLSHDEVPELLSLRTTGTGDSMRMELSVTQNDTVLWTGDLDLTDGMTRKSIFLCTVGGEDFLAFCRAYLEDESYRYVFEVFDLEENKVHYVDMEQIVFGVNAPGGYPIDAVETGRRANLMNWYLERGFLLCANELQTYSYSTQDTQQRYIESFAEVFAPAEDYSDCTTVQEKVERYNLLHDEIEGIRVPEIVKPAEFEAIVEELISELKTELWLGEELSETTWFWFKEYLNWAVQVIRTAGQVEAPLATKDVVYYFPKENPDMSEGQIAAEMLKTLLAEMTVKSDKRDFVINGYWVPAQRLSTAETGLNKCLEDWTLETGGSQEFRSYLRDWLLYRSQVEGFLPIADNMWYFVPEGYYSYEGTVGDLTMAEMMEASPEAVTGGMVPLLPEESEEKPMFVMMKYGNVYRLQSVDGMQITHDELLQKMEQADVMQDEDE